MYALKKNAGSTSMPWLGLVPEIMPQPNFFSLETFARYPEAKQIIFYSIPDIQVFVRRHPDICGTETIICHAKFTPNGVTFEPVPAEDIPPEPTETIIAGRSPSSVREKVLKDVRDSDDDIPF